MELAGSRFQSRLRFLKIVFLFQALCVCGFAQKENQKLYDGPDKPASELVTLVVNGETFLVSLEIHVNGKLKRAHSGAQLLPGTYEVSVLSLCGRPSQNPPSNPPVSGYIFFEYNDSFTAAAGDTVTYALAGGHFPMFATGRKGHENRLTPGSTCYFGWGAFHTVTRAGALEPDDMLIADSNASPPAGTVTKYLEAEGRSDQSAAKALLSASCQGDLAGLFQKNRDTGWRFSASNSHILHDTVPQGDAAILDAKLRQAVDGGASASDVEALQKAGVNTAKLNNKTFIDDGLVAEIAFTTGPLTFRADYVIFHLAQEDGAWKITKITDWWNPGTPVK